MVNVNISYKQYEGVHGHGYRALSMNSDNGAKLNNLSGANPVSFIEASVREVVKGIIANNGSDEDITVNLPGEIVLSAGLQTHLSDKFNADPLVNSVTFA
jgi:hypothetical protein